MSQRSQAMWTSFYHAEKGSRQDWRQCSFFSFRMKLEERCARWRITPDPHNCTNHKHSCCLPFIFQAIESSVPAQGIDLALTGGVIKVYLSCNN